MKDFIMTFGAIVLGCLFVAIAFLILPWIAELCVYNTDMAKLYFKSLR